MNAPLSATMAVLIVLLSGCLSQDPYKAGYRDGYDGLYNEVCHGKDLPAGGQWDNRDYRDGFAAGVSDAVVASLRGCVKL